MNWESILKTEKRPDRPPVKNYFLYYFVKVTGIFPAPFVMPKVIFKDKSMKRIPKGKLIIISNHTSFTDVSAILCAFWYRQLHFLAASELFETKLGNFFFRNMHCIKVDRQNLNMSVMRQVGDVFKRDKPVAIFPEGRIGQSDGEIEGFKSGVAVMAIMNRCPVLPIYLTKPEGKRRKVLVVGEPIELQYLGKFPSVKELEDISADLRAREIELENYYKETYDGRL